MIDEVGREAKRRAGSDSGAKETAQRPRCVAKPAAPIGMRLTAAQDDGQDYRRPSIPRSAKGPDARGRGRSYEKGSPGCKPLRWLTTTAIS